LHHAFKTSWLFEDSFGIITVLGVDKLRHETLAGLQGAEVWLGLEEELVNIAREWREAGLCVVYIAVSVSIGTKEWVELVVFNIDGSVARDEKMVSISIRDFSEHTYCLRQSRCELNY